MPRCRRCVFLGLGLTLACNADDALRPPSGPEVGRKPSLEISGTSPALASSMGPRSAISFRAIPGLSRAYGINDAGLVVGDFGGNNVAATWTQTGGLHSIG